MRAQKKTIVAAGLPSSTDDGISSFALFALIAFVLITPPLVFYTTGGASQAPGVAFVASTLFLISLLKLIPFKPDKRLAIAIAIIALISTAIVVHGLVAWQIQVNDFERLLQSLGAATISLVGASIAAAIIFEAPPESIKRMVIGTLILLLGFALLGSLEIAPYPPAIDAAKPVFPYTEPSHLALALSPLSIAAAVLTSGWRRLGILLALLLVAFFLGSMSTLVASVLLAAVALPIRYLIPMSLLFLLTVPLLETQYFAERLDFSIYNQNLSNLVYIQGWELLWDALNRTNGWGLGFQQLGVGQYDSPTANLVYRIVGYDLNIRDGGFTLSKIVAEFGLFGVALMIVYSFILFKTFFWMRRSATRQARNDFGEILAKSFILGSSIEFFVRGIGYFSPTLFLLVAAVIYLYRKRALI